MAARILVADDEPAIVRSLTYALEREGYDVHAVFDGTAALMEARTKHHDLAVLDVMLPGMSGLDVCRTIRAEGTLPVILLTARDTEVETIVGPRGRGRRLRHQAVLRRRARQPRRGAAAPPPHRCGGSRPFQDRDRRPLDRPARPHGRTRWQRDPADDSRVRPAVAARGVPRPGVQPPEHHGAPLEDTVLWRPALRRHSHREHPAEDRARPGATRPSADGARRGLQARNTSQGLANHVSER